MDVTQGISGDWGTFGQDALIKAGKQWGSAAAQRCDEMDIITTTLLECYYYYYYYYYYA